MPAGQLTLLTKPGCHLCDDARLVVTGVIEQLADAASVPPIELTELSILDDPALLDAYSEEIPVVLIGGRVHTTWRVDPTRLRAALLEG